MKDNIGGESAFSAKKMSLISKYIESIANLSHDGADSEVEVKWVHNDTLDFKINLYFNLNPRVMFGSN